MKRTAIVLLLLFTAGILPAQKDSTGLRKALTLYPLQKQIGYRSNFTRKWFFDFKGGVTYSTLPFFNLEFNAARRMVITGKTAVYCGIGLTLDSYVPGVQVPFGIETHPFSDIAQLGFIAEVSPKMTFGPTNFLNVAMPGHFGVAWYFRNASSKN
ncbi:MAG TPA: hypothetical protein VFU15_14815 [Bacteroidia bacterium]|nr:hypothetical protein [Bacteroidia bacterium]